MSARDEYRAAWRYVRMVTNPARRREANNSGLSLRMIGLAYRAWTASWRHSVTLRIYLDARRHGKAEARRIARTYYEAGF